MCFLDLLLRCFGGCFGIEHHDRRRSPKASMNAKAEALEPWKKKKIANLLGRPVLIGTETSLYEDVVLDCDIVMNPDHIEVECDSHLDVEKKQTSFDQVIVPMLRPKLFSNGSKLFGGPQKWRLYGPPPSNTGKATLLAAAKFIAKESGAVFINARKIANVIMGDRFSDCDAEQKRQLLAAVFSLAYKLEPAILYINDMDEFLGQLSQTNMKTEFMDLWDDFFTDHKHEHAQVAVLYATSKCNRVSPELEKGIQLRLPRRKERAELLKLFLKGERVEHNIDYDHVAAFTIGYANSDLFQVCKKAAFIPIRDHLLCDEKSGESQLSSPRPMSQLDLENVVIEELDRYLNKLLQQVKTISALLDQTHNEKHHHQMKRIMSSLAFSYRGNVDSNLLEKRDISRLDIGDKKGKQRAESLGQTIPIDNEWRDTIRYRHRNYG